MWGYYEFPFVGSNPIVSTQTRTLELKLAVLWK